MTIARVAGVYGRRVVPLPSLNELADIEAWCQARQRWIAQPAGPRFNGRMPDLTRRRDLVLRSPRRRKLSASGCNGRGTHQCLFEHAESDVIRMVEFIAIKAHQLIHIATGNS